ncbi:hypothetical protein SOASR029_06250 [Budvicia aquatica]|nr:hypothetical protein SOASR029_06250 [Budvicia aquatica]
MELFYNPAFYKIVAISLTGCAAIVFILFILNDAGLALNRRRYELVLKQAIAFDKLKNEDISLLATRWSVKKEKITASLIFILNDFLNDKDCSDEKLYKIRDFISWHQDNDPFSDLPDDIKLQLQKIQKMADNGYQEDILRLSKSLSDIYISNQRKEKRARLISSFGLFIGIVGLLYGFFK